MQLFTGRCQTDTRNNLWSGDQKSYLLVNSFIKWERKKPLRILVTPKSLLGYQSFLSCGPMSRSKQNTIAKKKRRNVTQGWLIEWICLEVSAWLYFSLPNNVTHYSKSCHYMTRPEYFWMHRPGGWAFCSDG